MPGGTRRPSAMNRAPIFAVPLDRKRSLPSKAGPGPKLAPRDSLARRLPCRLCRRLAERSKNVARADPMVCMFGLSISWWPGFLVAQRGVPGAAQRGAPGALCGARPLRRSGPPQRRRCRLAVRNRARRRHPGGLARRPLTVAWGSTSGHRISVTRRDGDEYVASCSISIQSHMADALLGCRGSRNLRLGRMRVIMSSSAERTS